MFNKSQDLPVGLSPPWKPARSARRNSAVLVNIAMPAWYSRRGQDRRQDDQDFFPLTVDYTEKSYAAPPAKIPAASSSAKAL
jgi:hypothetical protein